MNKRLLYFFSLSLILLYSCIHKKEVDYGLDEYLVDIVTFVEHKTFKTDNNILLIETEDNKGKDFEEGDRVYLKYSYIKGEHTEPSSTTRSIKVHSAIKVKTMELKAESLDSLQSLHKDPIKLESVWCSDRYLNMHFHFEYKSQAHSIGFICDEKDINKDSLDIYFVHDKGDDAPGALIRTLVSCDLGTILGQAEGRKNLNVHILSSNYGDRIYNLTY